MCNDIVYGRPDAIETEIISVADRIEASGFIPNLGDVEGRRGYSTHAGGHGVELSDDQRQHIAITRVMLKDVPILLFDEATNALDSEVEVVV